MPSDQGLGPDDRDNINDRRAKAIKPNECQPVRIGHPNAPRRLPTQNVQLMTQDKVLCLEPPSRLHERCQPPQCQGSHPQHEDKTMPRFGDSPAISLRIRVFGRRNTPVPNVTLGLYYSGQIAPNAQENSFNGTIALKF
jgi:hypothetical protein